MGTIKYHAKTRRIRIQNFTRQDTLQFNFLTFFFFYKPIYSCIQKKKKQQNISHAMEDNESRGRHGEDHMPEYVATEQPSLEEI